MAGKALIIYVSVHHGSTAAVAHAMAKVLHADVLVPEEVNERTLRGYDIIGFGSGIYFGSHHRRLRSLVERLPQAHGTRAFVFSTSGRGRDQWWPWQAPLESVLRDKGYDVVGTFACQGFDTVGPLALVGGIGKGHPDARDLARARRFAQRVARQAAAA
jgi:flavodoxin